MFFSTTKSRSISTEFLFQQNIYTVKIFLLTNNNNIQAPVVTEKAPSNEISFQKQWRPLLSSAITMTPTLTGGCSCHGNDSVRLNRYQSVFRFTGRIGSSLGMSPARSCSLGSFVGGSARLWVGNFGCSHQHSSSCLLGAAEHLTKAIPINKARMC